MQTRKYYILQPPYFDKECIFIFYVKYNVYANIFNIYYGCIVCNIIRSVGVRIDSYNCISMALKEIIYNDIQESVAPVCKCKEHYIGDSFKIWFIRTIKYFSSDIEPESLINFNITNYEPNESLSPWKEKFIYFDDIKLYDKYFIDVSHPSELLYFFEWKIEYSSLIEYMRYRFKKEGWSLGKIIRETKQKNGKSWFEPRLHPTPNDAYKSLSNQIERYLKNNQLEICEKNRR